MYLNIPNFKSIFVIFFLFLQLFLFYIKKKVIVIPRNGYLVIDIKKK